MLDDDQRIIFRIEVIETYLAPRIVVFSRKSPLSIKVYSSAGIVDRAVKCFSILLNWWSFSANGMWAHLRPRNSANVVSVPYSASNLSSSGVKAIMFTKAWKNPAWTRGNVFVRYTMRKVRNIRFLGYNRLEGKDWLVLRPISLGINAPHCSTSQTDCILKTQRRIMTKTIILVKRGRRKQ